MGNLFDDFSELLGTLSDPDHRTASERGELIGQGPCVPFTQVYRAPTVGGFTIEYRVTGELYRAKRAEQDRKLWQADYDKVCEALDVRVVSRVLGGFRFFLLGWKKADSVVGPLEQPAVLLCECVGHRGKKFQFRVHENCEEFIKECREVLEGIDKQTEDTICNSLVTHGAAVGWLARLEKIELGLWDQTLIERNSSMLHVSPELLEAVNGDARYCKYEEVFAVAALKRRLEIEQELRAACTEQNFGEKAHYFKIQTRVDAASGLVKISWSFKRSWDNYCLEGYRKEGFEFAKPIRDANGKRTGFEGVAVVDTIEDNGSVPERLEEGKEYRYSFFAVSRSGKIEDEINFTIIMPRKVDRARELEQKIIIQKLEKQLEAVAEKKNEREESDGKLREFFKQVGHERRMRHAIDKLEEEELEEARQELKKRSVPEFDGDKEHDSLVRVREFYNDMRREYLR